MDAWPLCCGPHVVATHAVLSVLVGAFTNTAGGWCRISGCLAQTSDAQSPCVLAPVFPGRQALCGRHLTLYDLAQSQSPHSGTAEANQRIRGHLMGPS